MYKIHYQNNDTDICTPHSIQPDPVYVVEIGHSYPQMGYQSNKLNRKYFVLHFVLTGKGSFLDQPVEGPVAFLMKPDVPQYYRVSDSPDAPKWEQYWIMIGGSQAETILKNAGIDTDGQIFPCPYIHQVFQILRDLQLPTSYVSKDDRYFMLSGLFHLLSLHSAGIAALSQNKRYSQCVLQVCKFIQTNYASSLCETDLANAVHLSTRYMHRIFKRETGIAPIHYLNSYRVSCAKKLLSTHNISISQVADAVGFSDPNYFCCVFKRYNHNLSPMEFKKGFRDSHFNKKGVSAPEEQLLEGAEEGTRNGH